MKTTAKVVTMRTFMYYLKHLKLTCGKLERLCMIQEDPGREGQFRLACDKAWCLREMERTEGKVVGFYKAALAQEGKPA